MKIYRSGIYAQIRTKRIAKQLDDKRLAREAYMEDMVEQVKSRLSEAGIDAEVYGRPKHIYSIYKKMAQKKLRV